MTTQFYSYLVEIDIESDLAPLEFSEREKQELIEIAHSNLHHAILDAVLSELSEKDKRIFLSHLAHDDHDKIWEHLNSKIEDVEQKIRNAAKNLKKELRDDIRKIKS